MPLPRDGGATPEQRVVRQLAEAMLYERLVDYSTHRCATGTRFEWRQGGRRFVAEGKTGAFGRIRLRPQTIETSESAAVRSAKVADLLDCIEADAERAGQLAVELGLTLTFARWNEQHIAPEIRRTLPYARLDPALDEGHPYHPCFKARTGFDIADHSAFGPEASGQFQLGWLAVDPTLLQSTFAEDEDGFWLAQLGSDTLADLQARKAARGVDTYGLIPIHPWQWRSVAEGSAASYVANGEMHFLGFAGDRYTASQSVRTLFNVDRPDQSAIKLPMNLVNSSARRILDPLTVCMAPAISTWLKDIVASDPTFEAACPLVIIGEHAGIVAGRDQVFAGEIAAIWRENISTHLAGGETAVPLNALMMVEADGRSFIADWINTYGVDRWANKLIDVVVLPVFHLLAAHGIATEAHGQNLILIHRDGWPVRLAMQDFHDSVEYVPGFLRDPALAPDFVALDPSYRDLAVNESYWMENVGLLRDLFIDALFVYNLSEISYLLEHCHGLPEGDFWDRVVARLATHTTRFGLTRRVAELDLFRAQIHIESLLARKLRGDGPSPSHLVANSLAVEADIRRTA